MDQETDDKNIEHHKNENNVAAEQLEKQLNSRLIYHFPWLSILFSLLLFGFVAVASNQQLRTFYQIPEFLVSHEWFVYYFIFFAIVVLLDLRQFSIKKHQTKKQFSQLKNHLSIVWQSKKKQQQRANTFSGHTDKLKNFISDKLLEYIEYDEKFLHFKGIASEVRHNGVISYDKVLTALKKAIEQQHFLSIYEKQSQQEPSKQTIDSLAKYQTAIDAMRYLWDLLDLSTADNMALHIGNQLIECEEHYYQLHLDAKQELDSTQSIPVAPTFYPQSAALVTLALLVDEEEIRNLISLSKINEAVLEETFHFENELIYLELVDTPELLGNLNHIVLLLENLIKNAQFFSQKVKYQQKTDRLIVRLATGNGYAHYSIYNRGPQITAESKSEIFKLGYSTRRNKQHHGKGLGLFFANQIVNGYQGKIAVENIDNQLTTTRITYLLASGEPQTIEIEREEIDDRLYTRRTGEEDWQQELKLESDIPVSELRLSETDLSDKENLVNQTLPITDIKVAVEWIVRDKYQRPVWIIKVGAFKKQHKMTFKPLDVKGVNFSIKLPTANSRLEEQEITFE